MMKENKRGPSVVWREMHPLFLVAGIMMAPAAGRRDATSSSR